MLRFVRCSLWFSAGVLLSANLFLISLDYVTADSFVGSITSHPMQRGSL